MEAGLSPDAEAARHEGTESPPARQQPQEPLDELRRSLEQLQAIREELRQQNEALAAAREALDGERCRYQELFDFAPDGYLVTDARGVIREANRAAATLLQLSPESLVGEPLERFVVEDQQPAFHSGLARLGQVDRLHEWPVRLRPHQGDVLDAALTVAAVRDAHGQPNTLRWSVRDVSERRRAEGWYRTLALRAPCILWHATVEDRGLEFLHWDLRVADEDAAQRILPVEIPPGLSYVQAWYQSRLPEDKARMDREGDREARAGRSYRQEFRCRRLDGEVRWLAEDVQIERLAPASWRAVGVCMDITDRKRLEDDLRQQAAELTQAGRAKDQFLAMLAHELRNPLAPILNAVRLLQQLGPAEPRLQRPREVIERQVRHQARLLDELLDVSRITRGKIELHRARLDLVRLLHEAVEDRRSVLEEAGLTLACELPEEAVWVEGDPTRLAQVVGNLLQNSAKFTSAGGRVTVRLTAEDLPSLPSPLRGGAGGEVNNPYAVITVADTGIGIEPEILPHVFETFTQADRSLDRSRGGLGLGLALVKGLVELHGGDVRAQSDGAGRGSAFTLRLPIV